MFPALLKHLNDTDFQKIHQSHVRSADIRYGHQDGFYRIERLHTPYLLIRTPGLHLQNPIPPEHRVAPVNDLPAQDHTLQGLGQLLSPGRVDAFADDAKGLVETDDDGLRFRLDDGACAHSGVSVVKGVRQRRRRDASTRPRGRSPIRHRS